MATFVSEIQLRSWEKVFINNNISLSADNKFYIANNRSGNIKWLFPTINRRCNSFPLSYPIYEFCRPIDFHSLQKNYQLQYQSDPFILSITWIMHFIGLFQLFYSSFTDLPQPEVVQFLIEFKYLRAIARENLSIARI